MPQWNEGLVGTALNIAAYGNSPLRVLAGPGTGKTYAMKRRVMRLLQEEVDPRRVLACTFTRTAARDIGKEIAGLGIEGAGDVWAGTLHGLCFSILLRQEVLEATGRVARPLADFETRFLLEDLKSAFGGVRKTEARLEAFAAAWARLQTDEPGWPHTATDKAFHTALIDWLTFHRGMLVGEMVTVTLAYLRDNPMCDDRCRFDHVIIDEFQDLNRAEQVLVDFFADNGSLTIIGDEDQSIYSFKHAHPEGIVTFDGEHPGTHDETLDVCRRCPTSVVKLASSVISNNGSASGRPLKPRPENGAGIVKIVQWISLEAEQVGIANYVVQRIENAGVSAGEVLILAPWREMGYQVRDALLERGVVAHSFFNEQALEGNPKELEKCEAQQSYALLTLLADPEDRVALRCWCGFGTDSLGEPGWRRIREKSEEEGESPRYILDQLIRGERKIAYTGPVVERYRVLVEQEQALKDVDGYELVDKLFPDGEKWSQQVRAIITSAFPESAEFDAEDLLAEVRAGVTQMETPTDVDFVRVMSLHKSKGLTARVVIVMGCNEGMIPRIDFSEPLAMQKRQLEEQRRLFYVALTRTTETLVLSSVTFIPQGMAFGMGLGVNANQASRFIKELGPTRPNAIPGTQLLD